MLEHIKKYFENGRGEINEYLQTLKYHLAFGLGVLVATLIYLYA